MTDKPIDASPDFWTGLGKDPELQRARQLLSMDELRRIYQHAIASQTATEPPLTDVQRSVRDGTFGVRSASPANTGDGQ